MNPKRSNIFSNSAAYLFAGFTALFISTAAYAAPPSTPNDLRADVYSSTAAEVFWERNTNRPLSYEVSLDGVVVATTSGTSYFNGNLNAAQPVVIDVVAIDSNGQRSGAANVVFNTSLDTTNPSQPPSPSIGAITSPANVRLDVYSATAGELFWDRSSQTEFVEITLVRRDGIDLARTQGTSFFDDTRTPGVAYRYEVIFLAFDEAPSEPAVFDENGNLPATVLSGDAPPAPANARIEVYSGTAAELFWDRAAQSDDVVETQVLRDGVLIGTTQGNSFFDANRTRGTEYRYELQSINRIGVGSSLAVVNEVMTSQIEGMSVVGRLGVENVLELAEFWLDGGDLSLIDSVDDNEMHLLSQPSENIVFDGDLAIYQCLESGSATFREGERSRDFYTLDRCVNAGIEITGSYNNFDLVGRLQFGAEFTRGRQFEQVQVIDLSTPGSTLRISGNMSMTNGSSTNVECFGDTLITSNVKAAESINTINGGGSTTIEDYSMRTSSRSGRRRNGSLDPNDCVRSSIDTERSQASVSSSILGEVTATISKELEIQRNLLESEEDNATAFLTVQFSDSSSVTVTMLSSRDQTAQIDIVADGSVSSIVTDYEF